MHSESGTYRGFFWFYFFNEHILRFLNLRYPRDYDTVPRSFFWLLHFAWFFLWFSAFFIPRHPTALPGGKTAPSLMRLLFTRAGSVSCFGFFMFLDHPGILFDARLPRVRAAARQRHGGSERACPGDGAHAGALPSSQVSHCSPSAAILWASWSYPAPGSDIAQALTSHPSAYTLSLGHMGDLTVSVVLLICACRW